MKSVHQEIISHIREMKDAGVLDAGLGDAYERWIELIDRAWTDPDPNQLRAAVAAICKDVLKETSVRRSGLSS